MTSSVTDVRVITYTIPCLIEIVLFKEKNWIENQLLL